MQVHDHLGPPLVEQQPHRDRLGNRVLVDGGGVGIVQWVVEQVGVVAVDVVAPTRLVEGGAARQAERVEVLPPRRRVAEGVLDRGVEPVDVDPRHHRDRHRLPDRPCRRRVGRQLADELDRALADHILVAMLLGDDHDPARAAADGGHRDRSARVAGPGSGRQRHRALTGGLDLLQGLPELLVAAKRRQRAALLVGRPWTVGGALGVSRGRHRHQPGYQQPTDNSDPQLLPHAASIPSSHAAMTQAHGGLGHEHAAARGAETAAASPAS